MIGRRAFLCGVLGTLGGLCAGCMSVRQAFGPVLPPPPQNYFSPTLQGPAMRRVAVLPLFNERYPGDYLRDVDAAFHGELVKKALFEVVPVSRAQMETLIGQRQISSVETLPADILSKIHERFGVDGVMFTDLTQFSPYHAVSIGVRLKLVDVGTAQIRWAFDYIYDAGNPAVAEAAKRFQRRNSSDHSPITSDGGSVLLSPSLFAKYVASETFESLRTPQN